MSQTIIPTTTAWNWDLYTEGTHILLESGPGGPRIMSWTTTAVVVAGNGVEIAAGSVVTPITTASTVGLGVVTESAASGAHVPVCINGVVRGVVASGAIGAGQRVEGASLGQFRALHAQTVSDEQMGVALTAAANQASFVLYVDAT